MGSACVPRSVPPIVEAGPVKEFFFTDFELEVLAGNCARFVLLSEQQPHYMEAGAERLVQVKCVTAVGLLPGMIRKLIFELGRQWQRDWIKGLLLPMQ